MRCRILSLLLVTLAAVSNLTAQNASSALNSGTISAAPYLGTIANGGAISLKNSGTLFHQIIWNTTGATGCFVQLDSSVDGVSWNSGDIVGSTACNASGFSALTSAINVNFVRIHITTLTTGTVQVLYNGFQTSSGGGSSLNGTITGNPNFAGIVTTPQLAAAHNFVDGVTNLSILDAATSNVGSPSPLSAAGYYIESATPECLFANPFPSSTNVTLQLGYGGTTANGTGNWSLMAPWVLAQDKVRGWRRANASTSNGDAGTGIYAADGTANFICGSGKRFTIKVPYGGNGVGQAGFPTGLDATSTQALGTIGTAGSMPINTNLFWKIAYIVDLNTAFDHLATNGPLGQPTWVANNPYGNGLAVSDGTSTEVVVSRGACTSQTPGPPTWSVTLGGKTNDGTCVWKNMGTIVDTTHTTNNTFSSPGWSIVGGEGSGTTNGVTPNGSLTITSPPQPTYQPCSTGVTNPSQGDLFTANGHIYYTHGNTFGAISDCSAATFTGATHAIIVLHASTQAFQEVGLAASPTTLPIVAYAVFIGTVSGQEKLDNTFCATIYNVGNLVACKMGTNYVATTTGFMNSNNHAQFIEDTTAPLTKIGMSPNGVSSQGSPPGAVTAFESRWEDLSLEANNMATQAYTLEYGQEAAGGDMLVANGGFESTVSMYGTSGQNSTWHGHSVGDHNSGACSEQRVASMLVDNSAAGEANREISNTTFTPYNPCIGGGATTKCIWARGGSSVKLTGTNHFEICTDALYVSGGSAIPSQRMSVSVDNMTASGTTTTGPGGLSQLANVLHTTTTTGTAYVQFIETNGAVAVQDDTQGGGATSGGGGGPFILGAADTNGNRYRYWPGGNNFTQSRLSPLNFQGHCIGAVTANATNFIYPTAAGANAQLCANAITSCASGTCGLPTPEACSIRHFYAQSNTTAVGTVTFTTRKNGSTTGMPTCNITAGNQSCNDTSSVALFAPGDKLSVSYTSAAGETMADINWGVTCQ